MVELELVIRFPLVYNKNKIDWKLGWVYMFVIILHVCSLLVCNSTIASCTCEFCSGSLSAIDTYFIGCCWVPFFHLTASGT